MLQLDRHDLVHGQPIGILAGWGQYPIVVARALRKQGARIVGLGVKDHVDPAFAELCDEYKPIGVAKLGAAIRFYRKHGVQRATMAGKLHKTMLFTRFVWLRHLPDLLCIQTFYPHFIAKTRDRKDDTLLGALVDAFAKYGIDFAPATDFAPELLVKHGLNAGRRLNHGQRKDVEFGWQLAAEMGRLDVGQSVCVKGRAVLAVEAIEGTDECIRRAGRLCPTGGFTVVKIAKPQQDMRFDVPTIGCGTLETMREAGANLLAVQAQKTILLDQEEIASVASRYGIQVVAIDTPDSVDSSRWAA